MAIWAIFLSFIFLSFSCAGTNNKIGSESYGLQEERANIYPGEIQFYTFNLVEFSKKKVISKLVCDDKEKKFSQRENKMTFFLIASYFYDKEKFDCFLEIKDKEELSKPIESVKILSMTLEKKEYPLVKLRVDKKRVFLSKKDKARVKREQQMLNKIYSGSDNELLVTDSFVFPLDSMVTDNYGSRRIYNDKKEGQHLGIDFRAKVGVPIRSTNRGRVVFAGNLFYTGKTVIIDHGLSLFSVYGHLSKIQVKLNQMVDKSTVIGLSGMSGRVTGPHLHWGIKFDGEWGDGNSLIKINIKDGFVGN